MMDHNSIWGNGLLKFFEFLTVVCDDDDKHIFHLGSGRVNDKNLTDSSRCKWVQIWYADVHSFIGHLT